MATVLTGDCRERMRELADNSVDAVVCDPPYGLEFMGKEWDSLDGDAWRVGGGFSQPGIGERRTQWTSYGTGDTANATCKSCGGRMRGANRCSCEHPDWYVKGKPIAESTVDSRQSQARKMQAWHHSWAVEVFRVLKPGGHLLAFGGTRTYHRLACALEDAGFEIRDCLAWMHGQGFPKGLDVSKQIDRRGGISVAWFGPWFRKWREDHGVSQKQVAVLFPSKTGGLTGCVANWELGLNTPTPDQFNLIRDTFGLPFGSIEEAEREVVGRGTAGLGQGQFHGSKFDGGYGFSKEYELTAPATDAAKQWDGWNVALKPAFEPIVVARKPLSESNVAANVLKHGTGALNIGACRIGTGADKAEGGSCGLWSHVRDGKEFPGNGREGEESADRRYDDKGGTNFAATPGPRGGAPAGRWPANVLLGHHEECRCVGTKTISSRNGVRGSDEGNLKFGNGKGLARQETGQIVGYASPDGTEEVPAYNCHPDCPVRLLDEQTGPQKSGGTPKRRFADKTKNAYSPFNGQENPQGIGRTEGNVSRFFYQSKAGKRDRWFYCRDCQAAFCETERADHAHGHLNEQGKQDWKHIVAHPTVKPVALIRYLCRLVTPPGGLILDPFGGTGTTAVAAKLEGFNCIVMEQDPEYVEIIKARVAFTEDADEQVKIVSAAADTIAVIAEVEIPVIPTVVISTKSMPLPPKSFTQLSLFADADDSLLIRR